MQTFKERTMKTFKQYINESIEDKGIFKAAFFGGAPGAGKSYIRTRINDGQIDPRVVNTDKYYEYLASQNNIDMSGDVPRWVLDKSKTLTKKQLVQYLNSMLPLYIDGTSADATNLLRRVGILEGLGYDTSMVWINTSLDSAIERVKSRERDVDEDFIRRAYDKLEDNKNYYKSKFDHFVEIDNDEGELTDEVIVNAYKAISGFYDEDIKNPNGKRNVEMLRESGEKYLVPSLYSMNDLERNVNIWYKRK